MLATFASLILLVQHISTMLQAPNIAALAGAELLDVVRAESPEEIRGSDGTLLLISQTRLGVPDNGTDENALNEADGYPIRVKQAGYIQYIDPAYLLTLAMEENLVFWLQREPGNFVWRDAVVAWVWHVSDKNHSPIDGQMERRIRRAFQIGNNRTPTQDVEYAVNQLVEIATRAMSPAINDPYTAMTCLDYLGDGLSQFIQQGEKGSDYYDPQGRLRLRLDPITFEKLLNAAFDMLRHCCSDNASLLLHMLEVIDMIGQEAKSSPARQELLRHVSLIQAESQVGTLVEQDRQFIWRSAEALKVKLETI
jgi:uncharacterized membrane protein